MKQINRANMPVKPLVFLVFLFFSLLHVQANPPTSYRPSMSPDNIAASTSTNPVSNINCDMIRNNSAGYRLAAIAWDEFNPGGGTYTSYVFLDNGSLTNTITLPAGSSEPDVVIGNHASTATTNIVAVVYTLAGNVYFETYDVYVSGGVLTYSAGVSIQIAAGAYPHIDLYPDVSMQLYDFAMVWHQTGVDEIYGIRDNIRTITSVPSITTIFTGGLYPDVAAMLDITGSPFQTAEVTFMTPGPTNLRVEEWVGAGISNVLNVVMTTPVLPRIEAMNTYGGSGVAKWMAVVEKGGGTYRDVWAYSDVNLTGVAYLNNLGGTLLHDVYRPVVAAGVGPATSGTGAGNIQYVGAACQFFGSDMFAMEFDLATTNPPSTNPSHSIINDDPMGGGSEPIAASSVSNNGIALLMAWWNASYSEIRYKYSNTMQFKDGSTKIVDEQPHGSLALYPNPSSAEVIINGIEKAAYTITDVSGRTLQSGNVKALETINISDIPAGMYIMHVTENAVTTPLKLVKQ